MTPLAMRPIALIATAIALVYVNGANLELPDSGSKISFGSGSSKGDLSVTCNEGSPHVRMLASSSSGSGGGATFTATPDEIEGDLAIELDDVPTTCIGVPVGQPCVSHSDAHPSMFYVEFEGSESSTMVGPFDAANAAITLPGASQPVGHAVYLTVPMSSLSMSALFDITGYTGDGQPLSVKVTVKYGTTSGSAAEVPYQGITGADTITVDGIEFAQPPSLPSPPVTPPPSPSPSSPWNGIYDFEDGTLQGFELYSGDCGHQPIFYTGSGDDRWNVMAATGGTYYVNTYRTGSTNPANPEGTPTSTSGNDGATCEYRDQTHGFEIRSDTSVEFTHSGSDKAVRVLECGTDTVLGELTVGHNSFTMKTDTINLSAQHAGKRGYLSFEDEQTGGWDHIQLDNIKVNNKGGVEPC